MSDNEIWRSINRGLIVDIHGKVRAHLEESEALGYTYYPCDSSSKLEPVFPPSIPVSLELENRIEISTLATVPDFIWEGKYLLCRCIVPPLQLRSLNVVVDDPAGIHAINLYLHNFHMAPSNLKEKLTVGAILIVKNPWFKNIYGEFYGLRAANPDNIVVLSEKEYGEMFQNLWFQGELPDKYQHLL